MISVLEAKIIAGRLFVKEYGEVFLRNNIDRLGTGVIDLEESVQVDFELSEKNIDDYKDIFHLDGEEHFPEVIFSVQVNLENGTATVLN